MLNNQPNQEINFQYGQNVDIGVSWDVFNGEKIDLDATVVMIDEMGQIFDAVYFNKLQSDCKAVRHHGDSKSGETEGYDEVISIDFSQLSFTT